jgi:hypothetical protein
MLTYDIIIKHLMPAINNFSLQSGIAMKSTDFPFFSKLFDDSFYRFGIKSNSNNNMLVNSILYCLSNDTITDINTNSVEDLVKQLDINIIIFDFKNNKIMMEYNDNKNNFFNPWKPTLYLANYDEWWEPIVCKDTKIFSFSSSKASILKNNILNESITRMNGDSININDNFNEIIEIEGFVNNENISSEAEAEAEVEVEEDYNNAFVKEKPKQTKAQLNKMKKDELIELCKQYNKTINISKPTKNDLINIILN